MQFLSRYEMVIYMIVSLRLMYIVHYMLQNILKVNLRYVLHSLFFGKKYWNDLWNSVYSQHMFFWNLPIVSWTYYMADITSDYTGKWNTWLSRTFILMGETIKSYKP